MATGSGAAADASTYALVTVKLPWKVWQAVERMAAEQEVTKTEVLRRCISVMAFVQQVLDEDGQVLVEAKDGSVDRVEFPWA